MDTRSSEALPQRALRIVAEVAKAAGCEVSTIPRSEERAHGFYADFLLVNGYRCSIHHLETRYKTTKRAKRWVTSTALTRNVLLAVEAVIFHLAIRGCKERTFIVPSRVLLETHFQKGESIHRIYLPTAKRGVYKNRTPLIDYWHYENAWHLLDEAERKRA